MFLFKCSRPGDRSGGRFVPREHDPESGFVHREDDAESGFVPREDDVESGFVHREDDAESGFVPREDDVECGFVPREDDVESGFVPREDDVESGFVPREDDVESGFSGRDDGRCLPEKVKRLISHDVYLRSWVEEGEIERSPVPASGRPTDFVDEVFCFEVENGETISDREYSPLDLQTSLSADAATCRMSGNAYEAPADCVVTFPMFPVGQMRLRVDSVVCEMGDVAFEASADGAISSPMLSFGQNGLSGDVSVSLSVGAPGTLEFGPELLLTPPLEAP